MERCSVVLTFESVDQILWCYHSNETCSAILLHGIICFSIFYVLFSLDKKLYFTLSFSTQVYKMGIGDKMT